MASAAVYNFRRRLNAVEQTAMTYTTSPSENSDQWYVWDMDAGLPPKPVFFGTMEEAGSVADQLNMAEAKWYVRDAAGNLAPLPR